MTSIRPTAHGFVAGDWSPRVYLIRIRPTTLHLRPTAFIYNYSTSRRHALALPPQTAKEIPPGGRAANEEGVRMRKAIVLLLILIGLPCLAISGAYWWSNVPPRRPQGVARSAVFLWTGHLGLPAPKHGTWLECWADTASAANRCRLTEMDGKPDYEGVFVADKGAALVPQSDLRIDIETTSNRTFWVRLNESVAAPLVFLQNGAVLVPKEAYQAGMAKLESLRQVQSGK
jgi:hypothetical protein